MKRILALYIVIKVQALNIKLELVQIFLLFKQLENPALNYIIYIYIYISFKLHHLPNLILIYSKVYALNAKAK